MLIDAVAYLLTRTRTQSDKKAEQTGGGIGLSLWFLISLVTTVTAFALSWNCNSKLGVDILAKVIYALFAGIFSYFYVIFYGIYRVLLKNPCVRAA